MSMRLYEHLRGKKWLVTGSTGQLGAEWCEWLEEQEMEFVGLTRSALDISDPVQTEQVLSAHAPDIVINGAAYTQVDACERTPQDANRANIDGPRHLAAICARMNILLVHFSTDYVFAGEREDRRRYPDGYPEHAPTDPINHYGYSKLMGEKAIEDSGARHIMVRVSWLCGRHGKNFVKTMLKLAEQGQKITVVDDQFGCPTFTRPVVINTMELIRQQCEGVWHVSSLGEASWYQFARAILKDRDVALAPVSSEQWKAQARRPAWSRLDTSRLSKLDGTRILTWQQELELLLRDIS